MLQGVFYVDPSPHFTLNISLYKQTSTWDPELSQLWRVQS